MGNCCFGCSAKRPDERPIEKSNETPTEKSDEMPTEKPAEWTEKMPILMPAERPHGDEDLKHIQQKVGAKHEFDHMPRERPIQMPEGRPDPDDEAKQESDQQQQPDSDQKAWITFRGPMEFENSSVFIISVKDPSRTPQDFELHPGCSLRIPEDAEVKIEIPREATLETS